LKRYLQLLVLDRIDDLERHIGVESGEAGRVLPFSGSRTILYLIGRLLGLQFNQQMAQTCQASVSLSAPFIQVTSYFPYDDFQELFPPFASKAKFQQLFHAIKCCE